MNKERDYFFDNLKAVLIFLVVLGHFLLPIHGESVLVVVKRLIYVFHMPLFVFVSGYFAKKIYKNGQYNFKKILYLIKAYIIFVIANRYHGAPLCEKKLISEKSRNPHSAYTI